MPKRNFQVVPGSGNVYRDLSGVTAGLEQARALIAAKIGNCLTSRSLSTRDAEALTGVCHSEFSRICNNKLHRFTLDRLITILGKLDQGVEVTLSLKHRKDLPSLAPSSRTKA